jgi:hypothetical protein
MYAALERRVTELEKKLAQAKSGDFPGDAYTLGAAEAATRRGPKPRCQHEEFLLFRDLIVDMLETHWPEIQLTCVPILRAESLKVALKIIARRDTSQHGICAQHLLRNYETLLRFLRTNRFRGDPRQIANALAGAPTLGFWRSLKLGQAEPCPARIGQRALKAYIHRKHRTLYDELEERIDLVHFTNTWRNYRKRDKNIRDFLASAIHHAWIVAEPSLIR